MASMDRHVRNRELAAKAQAGDAAARDQLVHHMRPTLLRLTSRWRRDQQTRDDMIQEGNLGVLRAIRDYDASTGNEFVCYAEVWIRAFISRADRANRSVIRMPQAADDIPAFEPDVALDCIPAEDLADSIGRAIVLVSALDRLHPFCCWVLCERYGLDRPASLDRDIYPESGPNDPDRWGRRTKFHRTFEEIAHQCGLSARRVGQVAHEGLENLRAILGDDQCLAAAG